MACRLPSFELPSCLLRLRPAFLLWNRGFHSWPAGSHPSPGIMGSRCVFVVFVPAFPRSIVLDMTGMRLMPVAAHKSLSCKAR